MIRKSIQRIRNSSIAMNYIWVFLGQNIGTVVSMLSLIVTLRIISTNDYGSLIIIQTYCLLISNIFCSRTFNVVIKYLTEAEKSDDYVKGNQYILSGFIFDVGTGIVALVLSVFLLNPIARLMDWDPEMIKHASIYLPVILSFPLINGTAVGVLRKMGLFKQVNIIHVIVYSCQLLILFITWVLKVGNLQVVLVEYALTEVLEGFALLAYSLKCVGKSQVYCKFWKTGISRDGNFYKHNIYYGLSLTFDQILGNVSTLLINRYIGNFTTAYIKIITKICSIFTKLTSPLGQVMYPELCRWISEKREKRALYISFKYCAIVCVVGAVLLGVLFSTYEWWISIFDPAMASAKFESLLYMVYTLLGVSLICINQLMIAMELVRENLLLVIIFNIIYIVVLIPSIQRWGVYGFLLLQILQLVAVAIGKVVFLIWKIRRAAA